jgi:acetyl esterase/lipase
MTGSKEWDNVKYLVKHGYAIASVAYRFTPEFHFPAQIQDCNAALNFILAHAADYSVSSNKFVVGGGSAGGHLALLLGMARQEKDFGADPSVRPLAILDFFGPTDLKDQLEDMQSFSSQKSLQTAHDAGDKLLGGAVENLAAKALWASPISYVASINPPVLILHGARDDLVPLKESQRLQKALEGAGVKNQIIVVQEAGHDGPLFSTPEIQVKVATFLAGIFQQANNEPAQPL